MAISSSNTELNEHNIIPVLDALRTSPKSERKVKLFEKVAEDAWKALQLEGDPNPILLENMLIETIKGLYDKPDSTFADNNAREMQAQEHDISLLMFGLLDGYYHTKLELRQKVCVPSKIRYRQYLDTGVFLDLKYPGQGTHEEIEKADKQRGRKESRPLNLIESIAKGCKVKIGVALVDLIQSGAYKNCSREAVFDVGTGQRTDLPKPHYTLENFVPKGREDDCTRSLESTLKSIAQPTPESTSESTQDSDPETSTEQTQEHTPKSHTDASSDGTPHPPKANAEMLEPKNNKKDKPEHSSKPNKWAVITGALAILLAMMLPFAIYAWNKSKNVNIDQVKADEGGGIVNPDEASTEPNMSITYQSPNGIKVDINISGISETASVSVDSDTEKGKIIISLDDYFNEGSQNAAIRDFSAEGGGHEDGN